MQSFILIGSEKSCEDYINKFKTDNGISNYLVVSYNPFKISDARLLQKTTSLKLREEEIRLIIIENPTLEAQHAILKTIEELPAGNILFFPATSKEELLPTIQSRCFIVNLRQGEKVIEHQLKNKILTITKDKSKHKIFETIDLLNTSLELSDIEKVIIALRSVLLSSINEAPRAKSPRFLADKNKESYDIKLLHKILKNLLKNYKMVKSNNINKRAAIENAFLDWGLTIVVELDLLKLII